MDAVILKFSYLENGDKTLICWTNLCKGYFTVSVMSRLCHF